jgi:D-3-phosphoglycerate dehydrogenase / 2-oxoglutarate reductase
MSDVVVSENISGPAMDSFRADHSVLYDPDLWKSPDGLKRALVDARALLVRNQTKVTADVIAAAPKLRVIARAGVGYDNIDVAAASAAGVVVTYTPAANAVSVAELAIGLMLAFARNIPAAHADTTVGGWNRMRYMGRELAGSTLGVVGFGRIGQMTAKRAKAFDMRVVASDAFLKPGAPALATLAAELLPLDELLAMADFVSIHVPLTPETDGLIGTAQLAKMKPTGVLINTSRGEVVDEPALIAALESRQIAGVALDVRRKEPPQAGALEKLPNVVLLPHLGAFTHEAQARVIDAVCRDVRQVLAGLPAEEYVNFATPKR